MMRLSTSGNPYEKVMAELRSYYSKDIHFSKGRIIGSMCTTPDSIAQEAYMMFIEANLGNPGLCQGTVELERMVIEMLLDLLGMDMSRPENEFGGGQIVSGGTEANITALWLARNLTGKKEIIFPESGHFSLHKAANLLSMKPRVAPLTSTYQVDLEAVKELVTKNTAALVGIAGTTELGQVDPINELAGIAQDHGIPLHIDAAFGGFVLPFLDGFHDIYDFRASGVGSMCVDPHKMGLATIPSGALLLRDKRVQERISVESPYLTSEKNMSLSGTKNSASVATTYAIMRYMGRDGYRKVVNECMENTHYLAQRLSSLGLSPVIDPVINILAIQVRNHNEIIRRMHAKGWRLSRASHPPSIRFVVMLHIRKEHIDELVHDFESALEHSG